MLKCREVPQLCSARLDSQLSFSQRLQLKVHLLICHRCRDYWRALRRIVTALPNFQQRASAQQIEQVIDAINGQPKKE